MTRPAAASFLFGQFRDISEYRTAFAEYRPQTQPESRSWLEDRLQGNPVAFARSEPAQSLFHWAELSEQAIPRGVSLPSDHDPLEKFADDEAESPYSWGLCRSQSLDLGSLDRLDAFST
jgi:hypothetical protein